jgi:hypothetical protein
VEFFLTQDPTVIIVYQQSNIVIYFQLNSLESWIIYGTCSHNGSCIDGAINPDLRPVEERLDCPVRPDIDCKGCDLRGEYL